MVGALVGMDGIDGIVIGIDGIMTGIVIGIVIFGGFGNFKHSA